MNNLRVTFVIIGVAAVSFLAGSYRRQSSAVHTAASGRRILYYYDPMHPAYKSDKPGIAPDCGMELEPFYEGDEAAEKGERMPADAVKVSPDKQQMLGIHVEPAAAARVSHTARLLGRVAADENRIYRLNSAVEGWVRRTEDRVTGSLVKKDDRLASFYSPEFYSAQQAYFYALGAIDRIQASGADTPDQLKATNTTVQTSADSLRNLGMSDLQIAEIGKTREIARDIWATSPVTGLILERNISSGQRFEKGTEFYKIADLSRIWILADVFENEAQYIRAGTRATVKMPNQQKCFTATVSSEPPRFDPATRTLKVRLDAGNPEMALRPDMFVDVEYPVRPQDAITVPTDSVVDSGLHKIVYVESAGGTYEPRQVETGWRMGDRVVIAKGLEAGERVVVSGTFLIDSESRMKLASVAAPKAAMAMEKVRDPVCGMEVDPAKSLKSEYRNKTYYFCSETCKREFEKNPERFLRKKSGGAE